MPDSPKQKKQVIANYDQKRILLESIQRGQEPLWNDPRRGLAIDMLNCSKLKKLHKESLDRNSPLSLLLDSSMYNIEIMKNTIITLVYEMVELEIDTSTDPIKIVNKLEEVLPEIIDSVLLQNHEYFTALGDRLSVSPLMLSMIGGALIQPSLIDIASKCSQDYLDAWELTLCPVCGRLPSLVVKLESEVWRFKCSYCRAQYKMDIFRCPQCGSEGAGNKEFLLVGDNQEFEVVGCPECGRYFKIINIAKLGELIPEGLEDTYTGLLDKVAREMGFIRLDESAP